LDKDGSVKSDRILIFDVDAVAGKALAAALAERGWAAESCCTLAQANELLDRSRIGVVLACLGMDGLGLELLDRVRAKSPALPALIATPAKDVKLRITGLKRGAADYLIRPFGVDELLARIATVQHRNATPPDGVIHRGGLMLDVETGRVGDGTHWTWLSPTERQAFALLLEQDEHPVTKNRLKDVLGTDGAISDNAIEVIIYRLRAKARDLGLNIRTYRGSGYMLECP
jgi:two-component system, OmpR family, response regulator